MVPANGHEEEPMIRRPTCKQLLVETHTPERAIRVSETPDRVTVTLAIVHNHYEVLVELSRVQWSALCDARYHLDVEPDCEPPEVPVGGVEVQP